MDDGNPEEKSKGTAPRRTASVGSGTNYCGDVSFAALHVWDYFLLVRFVRSSRFLSPSFFSAVHAFPKCAISYETRGLLDWLRQLRVVPSPGGSLLANSTNDKNSYLVATKEQRV